MTDRLLYNSGGNGFLGIDINKRESLLITCPSTGGNSLLCDTPITVNQKRLTNVVLKESESNFPELKLAEFN